MGTLFKNGVIITDRERMHKDIRIDGEVIAEIGKDLKPGPGDDVVDASGFLIIPGGVDPHTHLDLPFMGTVTKDDFESGTIAAAAGGTTTIIDFAIPDKEGSLLAALDTWRKKADGRVAIDYGLHMAVTWWDPSLAGEMADAVEKGVSSFKVFLAYKGAIGIDDAQMFEIMAEAKKHGALIMVHAENAEIVWQLQQKLVAEGKTDPIYHARSRPPLVEGEGTHRSITMAQVHDVPVYIVHMTAANALEKVRDAAFGGMKVFAETCPQYLLLDESYYERPNWEGAKWVMSPPLRSADHCKALWAGIQGGLIDYVGTDHCSFDFVGQKDMFGKDDFTKIPNGIPGIQDRLSLLYTYGVLEKKIDVHRWVALCATNPARTFGLYPKKGTIQPGSDADLVLWDPNWKGTLSAQRQLHKNDYNAFEGFAVQGRAHLVTSRGKIIWQDGQYKGTSGDGRFLARGALY